MPPTFSTYNERSRISDARFGHPDIQCDYCNKIVRKGEYYFGCLECHGWVPPSTESRQVRLENRTTTVAVANDDTLVAFQRMNLHVGFDLCSSCAKKSVHQHHSFRVCFRF